MQVRQQRFLLREWHARETRLLLAALIIAISMLSMLGFYSERIQRTLNQHTTEFLGGDIVITSPSAIPAAWKVKAQRLACRTAETIVFPSMVSTPTQLHLANIKAVSNNYPLYGKLILTKESKTEGTAAQGIPQPGTVWLDQQLLKLLQIHLPDKVEIGYSALTATHILVKEPDANPLSLNFAPRIIMNIADLPQTQIIQPGSRVDYHLYIAGDASAIQQLKTWLRPQLHSQQKLITLRQNSAELAKTLQKSDAFLHIAAIIGILLAGIAIATTAHYFIQRQTTTIALLRCFGLTYRDIFKIFSLYFTLIALVGSSIGCLFGYLAQLGLTQLLAHALNIKLLPTSLWPVLPSIIFGCTLLASFALPALRQLKQIPANLILRKQTIEFNNSSLGLYTTTSCILIALLVWYIRDIALIARILGGFIFTAAGLYSAAYLLLRALRPLTQSVGISWRYGLASLTRRASSSILQIVTFGFIFMVVLLQFLVRSDLIELWETQVPKHAPNTFAINIQPTEVTSFNAVLQQLALPAAHIYPMVRGRLTTLNGKPIKQVVPAQARQHNALNRELNLTWTDTLPTSNRLIAGPWWTPQDKGKALVSMDDALAKKFAIKLGDNLGFQIGDQFFSATVHNLRSVDWYSFQPNFFMIFPDKVLNHFPATYITSFLVSPTQKLALTELNQRFPSISFIDVNAILSQIRSITQQITLAANYILIFIIAVGLIVLNASLLTSQDERCYESAILRSLGASSHSLYLSLLTEFTVVGFIAGLLAVFGAALTANLLALQVFGTTSHWHLGLYLATPLLAGGIVGMLGLLNTYKVVQTSPLKVIREN